MTCSWESFLCSFSGYLFKITVHQGPTQANIGSDGMGRKAELVIKGGLGTLGISSQDPLCVLSVEGVPSSQVEISASGGRFVPEYGVCDWKVRGEWPV